MNTAENVSNELMADVKITLEPNRHVIFWAKVSKAPHPKGCWEWTGWRDKDGYGAFRHDGNNKRTHRLSFQMHVGPIPDGLQICHTCDNPPCVNPAHLFAGTHQDNIDDKVEKGRQATGQTLIGNRNTARGERNMGGGKLSYQKADEIRLMYVPGEITHKEIAAIYGVHRSLVGHIIRNELWVRNAHESKTRRRKYPVTRHPNLA